MTHSNGVTCGNCGTSVSATDVICPHCDVLLAAYQSPGGSTVGAATAITPVSDSSASAPVSIQPTVASSISDAYAPPPPSPAQGLRSPAPSIPPSSVQPKPNPLRGDSGLAATTSPSTSEIADELTEMARIDSSFAKSVEAQAKKAIVESDTVASVKSEPAPRQAAKPDRRRATSEPSRTERVSPAPKQTAATTQEWTNTANQLGENPDPNRTLNPPKPPRSGRSTTTENQPMFKKLTSEGNGLAIIAFVFVVAIVFRNSGAFLFLAAAVGLVVLFFTLAIKATKSNSRPTTRMPHDRKKRDR